MREYRASFSVANMGETEVSVSAETSDSRKRRGRRSREFMRINFMTDDSKNRTKELL